jgi:hypothetical protein
MQTLLKLTITGTGEKVEEVEQVIETLQTFALDFNFFKINIYLNINRKLETICTLASVRSQMPVSLRS